MTHEIIPAPATATPAPATPAPATPATPAAIEASLIARLAFTPAPRAARRWNGLTELKQRTFIQNLADSGSVTMAAKSIGASTSAMYNLRRREGSESFAAAWEAAIEIGARRVLDTLMEHAIHGTPETIIQGGEVVAERRKYNHRAMMWIVSQRFPEQYGSATGLMDNNGMSHAMQKLKARWEAEWREAYAAEQSAEAQAQAEAQAREQEEQRRELIPVALVKIYQRKVREERRYRLKGQTTHADMTLRQLTHIEMYMEFAGLFEPEIMQFFDNAAADPHPWETEAARAITAHRISAWAMDAAGDTNDNVHPERSLILRPTPLSHGPAGPMHSAMHGGVNMPARTRARDQAEAQMAEAQALWEACATEESWAGYARGKEAGLNSAL